jgi:hypothetical protein
VTTHQAQTIFGVRGELSVYGIAGPPRDVPLDPAELDHALRCGEARLLRRSHNLVTDIGLDALAALFGGALNNPTVGGDVFGPPNLADCAVREMRVTAQVLPTAPTGGDTALEGATLFSGDITGGTLFVTYPAAATVRFSAILSQLEQAGTTFTEEGLFNGEGKLLARTVFSELHVSNLNLQFSHDIIVARA